MNAILSILMLGVFAMIGGAFMLWRKGGSRKQIVLMLVAAAVLAMNVAILAWPMPGGAG